MTYVVIALAVLREIASREPQCVAAVAAGVLALLLTTRLRLTVAAHSLARRGEGNRAARRVTATVR